MRMTISCLFWLFNFTILSSVTTGSQIHVDKKADEYLNICLKGTNHKVSPGPESKLAYQCSPWSSRSCCTSETAAEMHTTRRWLNFDWDHCKPLSPRCREFFIQDLCFYECSPNVGPWVVEDVRKIRRERFRNVPLCQSECDHWWDACKDDFTCIERWDMHFNWTTGINTCPVGSSCKPFHEVYTDGNHFCEAIFGSFKVVPNSPDDCFYLWFNPNYPNPNERVARKKISAMLGGQYQFNDNYSGNGRPSHHFTSFFLLMFCFLSAFWFCQK